MSPDLQKLLEEALKQSHNDGIPAPVFYAVVGALVSAVGALWVYFRFLSGKLQDSYDRNLTEQKDRVSVLEQIVKDDALIKVHVSSEQLLKDRVESLQRLLESLRAEQIESTEKRFSELLTQNTRIVTAISESTDAVRSAVDSDNSVVDALKTLDTIDLNIQSCLRIEEDIRRSLEDVKRLLITPRGI